MFKNNQSGQMVLILILIMLVALTIAAGVFLDSMTNVQLTTSQQNSDRAFNLAEAGVEAYLAQDFDDLIIMANSSGGNILATEAEVELTAVNNLNVTVEEGDVATVTITGGTATSVDIYWTDITDADQNPSVYGDSCSHEVDIPAGIVVEKWSNSSDVIDRELFGPYNCNEDNLDGLTSANSEGSDYRSYAQVNVAGYDWVRIRSIYNQADILVTGSDRDLPPQQVVITSTYETAGSGETKSIAATKAASGLPMIFDYVLYSGAPLEK